MFEGFSCRSARIFGLSGGLLSVACNDVHGVGRSENEQQQWKDVRDEIERAPGHDQQSHGPDETDADDRERQERPDEAAEHDEQEHDEQSRGDRHQAELFAQQAADDVDTQRGKAAEGATVAGGRRDFPADRLEGFDRRLHGVHGAALGGQPNVGDAETLVCAHELVAKCLGLSHGGPQAVDLVRAYCAVGQKRLQAEPNGERLHDDRD